MKAFILWIGLTLCIVGYSQQPKLIYELYMVEEKPEFSGGVQALTQYIQSNFKIPYDDYIQKRQGKIFVSCVINKNGDVEQVKIIRGISETLNYEAIQVVQSLPKWKPAKHNNQLVNVRYIFPINIKF